MNVEYINPFVSATTNVLEMMAFVKPEAGKPYVKKDRKAMGDVSGVIGLTGHSKGVVVLSFSTAAACKIVGSMLGENYTKIDEGVSDAVGELTNMISGDARRLLAEKGFVFEAGVPSVGSGTGHTIESMVKGPAIALPFTVDGHPFLVEACFEE